jgi:DNA-binding NtrC family response regulator
MEWTRSRGSAAALEGATGIEAPVGAWILVIDDEENFAALLETILTDRGYRVQTALSEEAALELVEERGFDLALVDIRMGQSSGLSVLNQLKQRIPKIKVIMITAYPTPDSYQQSFQKGASAYCTKPLDFPYLLETIRRVLS